MKSSADDESEEEHFVVSVDDSHGVAGASPGSSEINNRLTKDDSLEGGLSGQRKDANSELKECEQSPQGLRFRPRVAKSQLSFQAVARKSPN